MKENRERLSEIFRVNSWHNPNILGRSGWEKKVERRLAQGLRECSEKYLRNHPHALLAVVAQHQLRRESKCVVKFPSLA